MMRKLLIMLCLVLLPAVAAWASPIGMSKAYSLAKSVLKGKKIDMLRVNEAKGRMGSGASSAPSFYVFNAENEEGFVVISSDDAVPSIIAYSNEGSFCIDNMPAPLRGYLDSYLKYAEAVSAGEAEAPTRADGDEDDQPGTIIVDALCKTIWGQNAPFNNLCPKVYGSSTPCGCVATAAAQVMKYWKWPSSGRGTMTYSSSGYGVITRDFSQSTYNWDIMKDKGGLIRDQKVNEAMATLCYDLGISVKMQYSPSGSGAYDEDIRVSLSKYFKYKASTIELVRRECFESLEAWKNVAKKELNASRPMICCAVDTTGSGHAFVIDGYDSKDFVHVNWGWDGSCNGFYNIETLAPTDTRYQFSEMQTLVIGIMPDYTEEDSQSRQYKMYMDGLPDCEGTYDLGSEFIIKCPYLSYLGNASSFFTVGIGLYDANGNYLDEVSVPSASITSSYTQQYKQYYYVSGLRVAGKIEKGSVADGKYAIRLVFQQKDFTDWMLPDVVGGSQLNWIPAVIKDGKIILRAKDGPSAPDAIEDVQSDTPKVLSTQYFDMQGRKVSSVSSGSIIIKKDVLSNGTTITTKVLTK